MSLVLSKYLSEIHSIFCSRRLTLACAESCTGGLLSSALTTKPGASQFFLGSVVSYHEQVKNKLLKVPTSLIQVLGEVSAPVALEMAKGVREEIGSDWSVAITGIAGPAGGTPEKPVGFVCFATVGPGYHHSESKKFDLTERKEIQQYSVEYALGLLLAAIR